MSFDELIADGCRTEPWPFEIERDRIVKLFADAADRLEQMASGLNAEGFWQRDIEDAKEHGHLSAAAVTWAKVMGPVVASVLVDEFRRCAEIVGYACMAPEVGQFSENLAGLAERVLVVRP